MSHAYGWAFSNPVRKVYYNITVTALSVTRRPRASDGAELLQVLAIEAPARRRLGSRRLNFGARLRHRRGSSSSPGASPLLVWRTRRIEERWGYLDNHGRA